MACAALAPVLATAQAPALDPLDAGAAVPPLQYRSAFSDYRAYDEPPRADWREANRTVDEVARRIGQGAPGAAPASAAGPAATPAAPASTGVATTPASPAAGHGGHGAVR